jgi:acetyltransferase-like isoleucine patch superfamily enzyme
MKKLIKGVLRLSLSALPSPGYPADTPPGLHLSWRMGWVKGICYRPIWKIKQWMGGPTLVIGKRFSLQGSLICRGPGTVRIGDDVTVAMVCTPFTHDPSAVIEIGHRCFLNGTRFGCARSIRVGDECILADARIMDTDFHPVAKKRVGNGVKIGVAPIEIGRNVWIAASAAILKGVRIGENSVIAFGAVIVKDVPANRIVGGNPAVDIAAVPGTDGAPSELAGSTPRSSVKDPAVVPG